jgi:hypothetical protein
MHCFYRMLQPRIGPGKEKSFRKKDGGRSTG